MGCSKLCLLLLLGTYTLAQQDVGSEQVCYLAKRFKNFRRFVYNYEAESFNGVTGNTDDKSGPKFSCKVEVDVPQTCSFVLRTTECSLSEISDVDAAGNPVYRAAAGAQAFKAAMAKNSLKITVEGYMNVELYPEDDEPVNILNIKRGIVSALLVPAMEEGMDGKMPTVHGLCPTDFAVNSREDIATDVTVTRDLSQCDWFTARRQDTSPLALISGMNVPLSKMINSSQTCNYKFDNQKKHMTSGSCTEKHLFLPLSQGENGVSALVKQTVTLQEIAKINDRIFEHNDNLRHLPMDATDEKSPVQTKDAAIATLQQLNTLSKTTRVKERANLFQKLVSEFRGLKADVLGSAAVEMMDMSSSLTLQALVQCGTPECTSALLKVLKTFDKSSLEVDATVYALGMLSNPSRLMVKDMLAMAQYKKSKPIMYALSNAVRKLYNSEGVTPEITAVSQFVASLLGTHCAGEKDLTYLTLRVVGNMGDALEDADAAIKDTLLKCMRQPSTTLSVQLAAIQAFRRMSVTSEVRSNLQRVSQYAKGAVQKRLAAYLILMRNPQDSDIELAKKLLTQEQNVQIKSFVTSHVYNIISSTDPEIQTIGNKILDALEDNDVPTHSDYTTRSRNYRLGMGHESMQAAIQGNVIFDPTNRMPREVMLETTLKAFGFNMDIWEVGMEGKGFEPTVDALFGKNGFFPDTVSKAIYWAEDMMPPKMKEVLDKWVAPFKSEGQKVPENLGKELFRNFNKLVKDLQSQESPEAISYLRLMGVELGYIKGNELKFVAENALKYADIFMNIIPTQVMRKLMSGTDNEIFAHYIFMDNKFQMSTASGLPLTFSMSGTFTPGAKGGLRMALNMKELSFMPSVGVEFVTKMGVHLPEFVASAVELHTNLYHESSLNAKITMEQNQIKLSIPAPKDATKLLHISNKVMIVGDDWVTIIPHKMSETNCNPLFPGVKYCIKTLNTDPDDRTDVPYYPLYGGTLFSLYTVHTQEVSEYTATIAYELLTEDKDGRQKVDSLKIALRAEGARPTEATATMKYNRNRNVFTTKVQVPDFDVEAGVKVSMTDSSKGRSLVLEISNKNVPQLSLIGRAKLQSMTNGMLQVQLLVPSLQTDAAITATVNKVDGLTMQIRNEVKISKASSTQAVVFKYGEGKAEVQLASNMNTDTKILVAYTEVVRAWLRQVVEDAMDQQVGKTDMKLRHIINKGAEAGNIWMDKISTDVPYIQTLRNSVADMEMPSMPEKLFMNVGSRFKYVFNDERWTIRVPLPLGGKSSEDLRIPPRVTSPQITLPQVGVQIAPREIQIPTFTIPSEYEVSLPLMGMFDMSARVNSNYYNWEAIVSAGKNMNKPLAYLAEFSVMADSPIKLLSFSTKGATEITDTVDKAMKLTIDGSLNHMFVKTGFDMSETLSVTDSVLSTASYKIYTISPLGVNTSLTFDAQFLLETDEVSGDINTDGSISVGPMTAVTRNQYTFSVEPAKKKANVENTLRVNSDMLNVVSKFKGSYADEELLIESDTNINSPFKHTTKMTLSYKDVKLTILSDSVTKADDKMLRSQIEFSSSEGQASLRIENQADDTVNRLYSLITGSLNPSGLEVNTDASMNIFSSLASHKATLALNANGLTTTCTTTAQRSPMTFENVFHGGVDTSGATMSLNTKGAIKGNKAELKVEGKMVSTEISFNGILKGNLFDINTRNRVNLKVNEDGLSLSNNMVGSFNEMRTENTHSLSLSLRSFSLHSKTDNVLDSSNSYMHDITVNMEPYTASVIVKNDLKIMEISFVNNAQLKAEPYTLELMGKMTGGFSEEQLQHTYEMKIVDMVLSAKCNTNGKLLGSHMTHSADMEIAGLTMKFNDAANINSPSLTLHSTVKTVAEPFTLTIDAIFNSDGVVHLYGRQSGEMYSKFLLKAEPLLLTHSFEYRASTSHELEDSPVIKTNMENKFNSMLSLEEQSVTLTMKCKVNDHTLNEEFKAYNNIQKIGIEMEGVMSSPIISEFNTDYSISGSVTYVKNSDSYFIQIPFAEHLPAVIENVKTTVMNLMDHSIEMLKEFDSKYEISAKLQKKVTELKEVIDNFDLNLFIEDMGNVLIVNIPTDRILYTLKITKDTVMDLIKKYNIATKFSIVYAKIEEILSSYEVEKMIEAVMEEIVKIMKQYQVREKIQSAFAALGSIDFKPLIKKMLVPVQELVDELYLFDFKQLMEDISDYFMEMVKKIKSFDYDTFTVELKEKAADMSRIPCFGKLNGEFRFTSPHYKFKTTADLDNITDTSDTPEFKISLKSQAKSSVKILEFTVDASAHLAAPKMSRLTMSENIDVDSSCFTLDHEGTVTLYGLSAQASGETKAKVTTEIYASELVNKAFFAMENGISATAETTYKHTLNMPPLKIFTEALINQKSVFQLEDGTAHLTFKNLANEKYEVQDISDERTHKSDIDVVMDLHTAKVTFTGETGCSKFKMNHNVMADVCIFRHVIVNARVETEAPFMKSSVAEAKFQAKVEDMKIDFTASHNAELIGKVEGTLSSSAVALITPNELMFDTKNKGNAKIYLPFQLPGKVDLQNDIALTLNSNVQQARWTGLARFNQYRYSHLFTMDNNDEDIQIFSQINGEANLDSLKARITIPEIIVPFSGLKTPKVDSFSLWEDTCLGTLLVTTQQTFDMNSKMTYKKNPNTITIDMNLEPIINAINRNAKALRQKVLISKDKAVATLAAPVPRSIPSALSKLTLPEITLPQIRSINIPVMGDLTYELSMKTAMLSVKTDASILNKDDIIVKLDASSTSEFDLLAGKIQGNVNVNAAAGFKMDSTLSVKYPLVEVNHDGTIILSYDNVETSITNSATLSPLLLLSLEIHQVITGNSEEGLVVSMSTPPLGHIAVQVQMKRPVQLKARLYGRYPSAPTTDVDILGLKMSAETPVIQTSYNMEMPNEVMTALKKQVPNAIDIVQTSASLTSEEIMRLKKSVEKVGKRVFKRAAGTFAKVDLSDVVTAVTDNTILILKNYRKRVETILDAIVKFLRDTKFTVPWYEEKMSGFEIYKEMSAIFTDVLEEIIKFPNDIVDFFSSLLQSLRDIEFRRPGANYMINVGDIFDDMSATMRPYQDSLIAIVKKLGNITLEDIMNTISEMTQAMYDVSVSFLQTLKTVDAEKLSAFVMGVYDDVSNSSFVSNVITWIMVQYRMFVDYITM